MPITVRRATVADAELLSSLNAEVQAIHAAALPRWFKPPEPQSGPPAMAGLVANPSNLVFVAEIDGEPAATSTPASPATPRRHGAGPTR